MTTVIIPTRHRPGMLIRCLDSLFAAAQVPDATMVMVDDDPDTVSALPEYKSVNIVASDENIGFFQSLNRAFKIAQLPEGEPFCYFGKDVIFHEHWLEEAERCFSLQFQDGLGLLTFKDDVQNGTNASHGMTTRRWLKIVYGEPFFPRGYFHYFCDTEFTLRSRDLGRFWYCQNSYVPHHHEPTGRTDKSHDDKGFKDQRHLEWAEGGLREAKHRLGV